MKFEQRILDFVRAYEAKRGRKPGVQFVARCFPKATPATVAACLRADAIHGSLPARNRSTRPLPRPRATQPAIPLQGSIAAGFSAPAGSGLLPKGNLLLDLTCLGTTFRPGTFAMRVEGHSMVKAHIHDGDIVLLEPGRPKNGDIVAAAHNGCLLLKRLVMINRVPYLKAENTSRPGMVRAFDKPIHGIFRGLLRLDRFDAPHSIPHKAAATYGPSPLKRSAAAACARQTEPARKPPTRQSAEPRFFSM